MNGIPKGVYSLWLGQGLTAFAGFGAESGFGRRSARVKFKKQSGGLGLKEGRPAREGVHISKWQIARADIIRPYFFEKSCNKTPSHSSI